MKNSAEKSCKVVFWFMFFSTLKKAIILSHMISVCKICYGYKKWELYTSQMPNSFN